MFTCRDVSSRGVCACVCRSVWQQCVYQCVRMGAVMFVTMCVRVCAFRLELFATQTQEDASESSNLLCNVGRVIIGGERTASGGDGLCPERESQLQPRVNIIAMLRGSYRDIASSLCCTRTDRTGHGWLHEGFNGFNDNTASIRLMSRRSSTC